MNIKEIRRPQVIDQRTIDEIRSVLDAAERGEVTGIAFVANMADDHEYFRASEFQNAWSLLGALEYAKDATLRAMGYDH